MRLQYSSGSAMYCLCRNVCIFMATLLCLAVARRNRGVAHVQVLRRQIRNFLPGQQASLTLVFQTQDNFTSRWFRKLPQGGLPYAEIPDMLSTKGDPSYDNSTITSGHVYACSLIIKEVPPRPFPATFSLVLTFTEHRMQYHIDVWVDSLMPYKRENLDSIRWLHVPPPTVTFGYGGQFEIACKAILDTESRGHLDELHMFRTSFERNRRRNKPRHLTSTSCGSVHRENNKYVEDSGKYIYKGRRTELDFGFFRYHVMMGVLNATSEDAGMYTCALERKHDRTYVSSWIHQGSLLAKPLIEFLPCEGARFNVDRHILHLVKFKETCFRCRAYGYPSPQISMMKDGSPLREKQGLIIDAHLNIVEGGLAEVTYTFLRPSYNDAGQYACSATNSKDSVDYMFKIFIIAQT